MLSRESPPDATRLEPCTEDKAVGASLSIQKKPNLVVIGAMKASTTTFYELITRHPKIWFSSEKEPHYFTSTDYESTDAWNRYLQLFDAAPPDVKYIGEASTGYSKAPHFGDTPRRLMDRLNNPKLIYLVRDPVARTISNYHHSYLSGHYAPGTTLSEALEKDSILIDASCYERQIASYEEVFHPSNLLILTTDELHASHARVMNRVEEFLDLPAYSGWDAPLPQSNSKQSLGNSLAWQSSIPQPLLTAARNLIPKSMLQTIKSMVSTSVQIPEVTEEHRHLVFDRIRDDLACLQLRLGDSIKCWPSVQQLGES